jgi:site-specific DNA-cytosine methylase
MIPRDELNKIIRNIRDANASGDVVALGACIFAGGFSLGMQEAGFKVAGHLELPDIALGAEVSSKHWPVVVAPLNKDYEYPGSDDTTWESAVAAIHAEKLKVDVLYCNPPCVAYAKQGSRKGLEDDRMCYVRYCAFDLALKLQPTVWVWELVDGIFDQDKDWLVEMAKTAGKSGYHCYAFLTTSALHGGFQNRIRFHFMASKVRLDFDAVYANEPSSRLGWKTLGDALAIVEEARASGKTLPNDDALSSERNSLLKIIPFCPPGGYLRDVHDEVMRLHYTPRGKEWNGEGRAGVTQVRGRRDRTCPVIVGGHTVIHPEKDRFLTIRENATMMGFPLDYQFSRGTTGYQEVGRGLCTHNAAFVGRVVLHALRVNESIEPNANSPMDVVDWRGKVSTPSISSTSDEKKAWWSQRHPDLPVEWAVGRAKNKPGRPVGYSPNKKVKDEAATSTVAVVGVTLGKALTRMGVKVSEIDQASDEEFVPYLKRITSADAVVVGGPDFIKTAMIAGAAVAAGCEVFVLDIDDAADRWEDKDVVVLPVDDETAAARLVAEVMGVNAESIAKALIASMTPEELIKLLTSRSV